MSWKVLRGALAIGLTALIGSACSTSRRATEVSSFRFQCSSAETVADSLREEIGQRMEENVTEREVVTWMHGDTVKAVRVTERVKGRNLISTQETKREAVRVVRDTVVVERRDTIVVEKARGQPPAENRRAQWLSALRWIFWIIVAIGGLVITITITKTKRFF